MSDNGFFGRFGGKYVAEILRRPLDELEAAFQSAMADRAFLAELETLRADYVGRPTPFLFAENATRELGGGRIYIKMEGLAHTGAHKINNAIAQALLARRMGKRRVIAETGAGQHGLATAAACAKLGLECVIYMGEVDVRRQQPNVAAMELYGARVVSVTSGSRTLKDAINEAYRDWSASFDSTHYLIGSALGPAPFPDIVRTFQSVIGREVALQIAERGLDVEALVACVGGGSNAMGMFAAFIDDPDVRLCGYEAAGEGVETGRHAASITGGSVGVLHGMRTFVLQDADGQTLDSHSISAGLDYPGVGPEHAYLAATGRATYEPVTDAEAMEAFRLLTREEGIMPAIESAHAVAGALRLGRRLAEERPDLRPTICICLSGRGDKDTDTALKYFGLDGTPDRAVGGGF